MEERAKRREEERWARGDVTLRYNRWLEEMDKRAGAVRRNYGNLTLGYVTTDVSFCFSLQLSWPDSDHSYDVQNCPGVGDDILHSPPAYYAAPDYVQSTPPDVDGSTPVDFIFVDYVASDIIAALNDAQSDVVYSIDDVGVYSSILTKNVLPIYAQLAWN